MDRINDFFLTSLILNNIDNNTEDKNIISQNFKSVTKKGKQIIATSQSIEFINEFSYEDIIVVDRKDETSYFRRLEEKEVKEWLNEFSIGDIWGRNIIGGTPNDY